MGSECYRINTPNVVQETIENEAVVINLVTGRYYSLEGTASVIWRFIEKEAPVEVVISKISRHYDTTEKDFNSIIRKFLEELKSEGLIVDLTAPPSSKETYDDLLSKFDNDTKTKGEFSEPILQKFTDMEDLLLLDPIHEVDDTGWPAKPDRFNAN